ncbi:TetR family transcriptional regulator [Clavibacter sp. Sh2088]|uniref:TetR family transcriptional regulator n=1 Tax=Clavibacter sp. Sh2088 TaxID=3397676 RepID=UPI0039E0A451
MVEGQPPAVRRRSETRRRLLSAAAALFEESGRIGQRVEDICARAGFTRGAFYSNFTSVDEVYLALHEEQAAIVWGLLRDALDTQLTADSRTVSLDGAVQGLLGALPASRDWFSLRSVLLARAAADPAFAAEMMMDDAGIASELGDRFIALAAVHGRVPDVDPAVLAKAVVAAHIGALSQSPIDADAARTQWTAVAAVIRGLTSEPA